MSRKVGIPWMKLNSKSYSVTNEHHGNDKAVICEAMDERWGSDPDINRDLTATNVCVSSYGSSGLKLLDEFNKEIEKLSDDLKEQGKRGIRSDAITSFAMIIKPDKEIMDGLTRDEQIAFFRDAMDIVSQRLGHNQKLNNKANIRAFAIHFDEGNPHMHLFGIPYTSDGRLSAKEIFTPQLNRWLNEEFPKLMNERGWNLEPCINMDGYDPDKAKTMDKQQLEEYKEYHKELKKNKRKERSKRAKDYKEAKDIENAVSEAVSEAVTGIDDKIQQIIEEARSEAYNEAYKEANAIYQEQLQNGLNRLSEAQNRVSDKEVELDKLISSQADFLKRLNSMVNRFFPEDKDLQVQLFEEFAGNKKRTDKVTGKETSLLDDFIKFKANREAQTVKAAETIEKSIETAKQRIKELEEIADTDGLTTEEFNELNRLYKNKTMAAVPLEKQEPVSKPKSNYATRLLANIRARENDKDNDRDDGMDF